LDLPTLNKPTTGRRKVAIARVRLVPGSGQHRVNGRALGQYFPRNSWVRHIEEPLVVTHREGTVDIVATTTGGGQTGQAGAIRLALARALVGEDETLRPVLRRHGMLTRDPRVVERKKYGQAKARKRFQFSKR
jgi:small subunit ribosomal protein S9